MTFSARAALPRVSFRIRRRYFDAIVRGEKTTELRRASSYWYAAVGRLRDDDMGRCGVAVFVCGRDVHRRVIVGVDEFESAEEAADGLLSDQGREDLGDGPVLAFLLGEVAP